MKSRYQDRSIEMPALHSEPFFDALRQDPRFEALLKKIGASRAHEG